MFPPDRRGGLYLTLNRGFVAQTPETKHLSPPSNLLTAGINARVSGFRSKQAEISKRERGNQKSSELEPRS
jgi:hypothetical protein